jgi:hypothetical protein
MTLLDRFRTQPRQKHADPLVRLEFVEELPMDERDLLGEMAREDADARVRRAAVAKLLDPAALAGVASGDADADVREQAVRMLRDIALDAFEGVAGAESLAAVDALSDAKALVAIAKAAPREDVAIRALGRVRDARGLGSIARHAQLEPIRLAALAALDEQSEVLKVALNSEFKDTALAALERVADRADLEQVVTRGKNKSAVKRARGILRQQDEEVAVAAAAAAADAAEQRAAEQLAVEQLAAEQRAAAAQLEAARAEAPGPEPVAPAPAAIEGGAPETVAPDAADPEVEVRRQAEAAAAARLREEAASLARQRAEEQAARDREQAAARAEAEAREARTREDALHRLITLAARVEVLATHADLSVKAAERALRDIRAALGDLPPLPSRQAQDAVVHRLKLAQSVLAPKLQEMLELADWRRWANLGVQEQLCVKMEALAAREDPAEIATEVRSLQEQWREVSDVPRPQGDALWRRFKAAHDVVWPRCEAHFAAEHEARAASLAAKIALCERAEALADSTQWIQTAEEIKRLQAEWQGIGAVPRGQEKAIWQRFRSACDRFFTRRQADLAERKQVWAVNMAAKEALCVQVEALVDSTDWEASAAAIKRLQAEWKAIGPVKKTRSEAIWQRFRGACDRFFARYAQRHEIARGERVAAREAICADLETLAASLDGTTPSAADAATAEPAPVLVPADLLATIRGIRSRWQRELDARGVDREQAAALDQRFGAAFARVAAAAPAVFAGTDLDPDANRKRMDTLVQRMEDLARSLTSRGQSDAALSPTNRLAAMLKDALAANTIGGKGDDEARLRASLEEVRQAQASWARIGVVPHDVRRALADRFQRACRQIEERAGAVGRPGPAGKPGKPGRAGGAG